VSVIYYSSSTSLYKEEENNILGAADQHWTTKHFTSSSRSRSIYYIVNH